MNAGTGTVGVIEKTVSVASSELSFSSSFVPPVVVVSPLLSLDLGRPLGVVARFDRPLGAGDKGGSRAGTEADLALPLDVEVRVVSISCMVAHTSAVEFHESISDQSQINK